MVQICKNTIYKYCHFEYLNKHEEKISLNSEVIAPLT